MKRKLTLCAIALVVLAIGGFIAWPPQSLPPVIRFDRLEQNDHGTESVVFHLINPSSHDYSYQGSNLSDPLCQIRSWDGSHWKSLGYFGTICGVGLGYQTLSSNSSTSIECELDDFHLDVPYQIGITFERGTESEIRERKKRERTPPSPFKQLLIRCGLAKKKHPSTEPTWSDTVTP